MSHKLSSRERPNIFEYHSHSETRFASGIYLEYFGNRIANKTPNAFEKLLQRKQATERESCKQNAAKRMQTKGPEYSEHLRGKRVAHLEIRNGLLTFVGSSSSSVMDPSRSTALVDGMTLASSPPAHTPRRSREGLRTQREPCECGHQQQAWMGWPQHIVVWCMTSLVEHCSQFGERMDSLWWWWWWWWEDEDYDMITAQ